MAGENDILTRDENGDLAVRTVSSTESATVVNPDDVYTRDTDGNLCIRTTGSGGGSGGDQHNLGWYATQSALEEAHPTAEAGDWAIVGSTDTVWIWDTDTNAWKDSDQKGQVTSVNGQTGVVSLGINDVAPTQTGKSGYVLGTDGFVAGWVKPEIVQRSALPQASEEEVGNIYQYVGTTDANYTNGYFYKCVSDGQTPATYSWERVDAQPAPVIPDPLPSQTGQSGKFLTTDGTNASWSDKPLVNTYTGQFGALGILGTVGPTTMSGIAIGSSAKNNGTYSTVAIGPSAYVGYVSYCTAIGGNARAEYAGGTSIGAGATSRAVCAIQIGGSTNGQSNVNSDANTFKVANANGNFEIMSADGTIPEARLADTTNAQQGDVLTLDSNGNAVWQAGSSGGVSDVTVNGTSVVSGGVAAITCATIDDTSTSSLTATWSASKLNTTIGNIESLLAAI